MSQKLFFPDPAKLVMGVLASSRLLLEKAKTVLEKNFSSLDLQGEIKPFQSATQYYCNEMGPQIWRQFLSFQEWVPCEKLASVKALTNELEKEWIKEGKRGVNLDPGYVTLDKLVVASTKPASYRIYLGEGIYAQTMLYFEKEKFSPWPWTYADYRWESTLQFFNKVRAIYKIGITQNLSLRGARSATKQSQKKIII